MRKILASFLQALIGSIKKVKPFVTHLQKYLLTFNNVIHSFYYMNIKFIIFSFLVVSRRRPRINVSKYLPLPTYLAIQFNLFLYFSEQTHCKHNLLAISAFLHTFFIRSHIGTKRISSPHKKSYSSLPCYRETVGNSTGGRT